MSRCFLTWLTHTSKTNSAVLIRYQYISLILKPNSRTDSTVLPDVSTIMKSWQLAHSNQRYQVISEAEAS